MCIWVISVIIAAVIRFLKVTDFWLDNTCWNDIFFLLRNKLQKIEKNN